MRSCCTCMCGWSVRVQLSPASQTFRGAVDLLIMFRSFPGRTRAPGSSEFVAELVLEGANRGLVALVARPLPDPLGGDQPGPRERLQVRGGGGLGDAQLVGDEDHADAVVHKVSVALGREIRHRVAEPFEDLQAL